MSTSVGVVVVTYNSAHLLPDALAGIAAATDEDTRPTIVVVDNASADDLPRVLAARPDVRLVQLGRNAGYAAGVNAGVTACGDVPAVLVLNPDVRLQAGALTVMTEALRAPGVGIVVPQLLGPDGSVSPSLRREPTIRRAVTEALIGGRRASRLGTLSEVIGDPARYRVETDADWATGAVMLISSACLTATGPWDESFLLYAEETDFALRARDNGFRLRYTPRAVATHIGGESNTSPWLWSLLTLNRVRMYRRRHGRLHSGLFALVVTLNEAVRAVTGRATARAALTVLLRPSRRPKELPQG